MSETVYLSKIDNIIRFIVESKLFINKHTSFEIEHFVYINLAVLLLNNIVHNMYFVLCFGLLINLISIILIDKYNSSSEEVSRGLDTLKEIRRSPARGNSRGEISATNSIINVVIKDTGKMIISFSAIRILTLIGFGISLILAIVPMITTIIG